MSLHFGVLRMLSGIGGAGGYARIAAAGIIASRCHAKTIRSWC